MWRQFAKLIGVVCVFAVCAGAVACQGPSNGSDQAGHGERDEARGAEQREREEASVTATTGPDAGLWFPCGPQSDGFGFPPSEEVPGHFVDWTPDGSHLIFDDVTAVLMVDAAGTRLQRVVDANPGHQFGHGMHADVSPDGNRVVYSSCEYPTEGLVPSWSAAWSARGEYHYEIATVAIDGTAPERLTENGHIDHFPVWSPDGSRIAFLSGGVYSDEFTHLRAMSVDPSQPGRRRATRPMAVASPPVVRTLAPHPPAWSPDGERLAFLEYEREVDGMTTVWGLYIAAPDSMSVRKRSETVGEASWSPDGQRLALARLHSTDVVLVTIAADGSDPRVITTITNREELAATRDVHDLWSDPAIAPVAWSPDGTHILFRCGERVCVVNLDGDLVGQSPIELVEPRGRPQAAWSPDGSRIAVRVPGNPTPNGRVVLYTMAPDGTDVRVLVRGGLAMVAEHSGHRDRAASIASCTTGFVVPEPERHPGLVEDCEALMGLRDTLAGKTILNWSPGTPIDHWVGVTVSGSPRRVTRLELKPREGLHSHESHELTGSVPPELGSLPHLRTLVLSDRRLTGGLPPELGDLTNLRELRFSHGTACVSGELMDRLVESSGVRACEGASSL